MFKIINNMKIKSIFGQNRNVETFMKNACYVKNEEVNNKIIIKVYN